MLAGDGSCSPAGTVPPCGSSLGGRDDRWPDFIVVNAGTLDDDPGTRPLYHIYVGSKAPWFMITDSLTQFATAVEHEE